MDIVRMTPEELAEIAINGTGRNVIKEEMGIQTKKISGKLSDLDLHLLEVKGQYAVSKFLGVPMDWSICVGGKKTPHFTINGISMRVQMPTYHPPVLKLNRAEDFRTDLMIVCMEYPGEDAVIAIYGCVSRERFLQEHILKDFGEGKRLSFFSWDLTPLADYQLEAQPVEKKPASMEAGSAARRKEDVG